MTTLYWNGSAFAPMNKTAAKKDAVVLRLETAFSMATPTEEPLPAYLSDSTPHQWGTTCAPT